MKNTLILLNILKQIGIRGSVHTQTATLNVKLTFVGVRIKVPDIRVMAEMSKTNLKNTMCNNSNKKKEKTWFFSITVQKLATYIFNRTFSTLYFWKKSDLGVIVDCLTQIFLLSFFVCVFPFFKYTNSALKTFFNRIFLPYRLRLWKQPLKGVARK